MKKGLRGVTVIEILIGLLIVGIILGSVIGSPLYNCKICSDKTKGMGFPHKWGWFSGCMIDVNGSWMPLDNYRYFEGDK